MDINSYIKKLNDAADNMDAYIKDIVIKNQGTLLGQIKLRLFNKSEDAYGNKLGPLAESTKKRKKREGKRASFVTLRDSGDWYASMFIDFKDGSILVDASDWKTDLLEDIYGEGILGLSDKETELFVDSTLEPELEKLVDLGNLDLGYV